MNDHDLAKAIAVETGELLLRIRTSAFETGKALGARGDREANELILHRLREARPSDPIFSEESQDDLARCESRRVWIVDPLDGTREYTEGRGDWAVHIGLAIDGVAANAAVALPAQGLCYTTADQFGAPRASDVPPRLVVSRSRPPEVAQLIADEMGAALIPMGSAGAKAMAVVDGRADIYIHAGGQYQWDNCAPTAVAQSAGLHVSRIDGTPIVYNGADAFLPDLLICRKQWSSEILRIVSDGVKG